MFRYFFTTFSFLFVLILNTNATTTEITNIRFPFYSEFIEIKYEPEIAIHADVEISEIGIRYYYSSLEKINYASLLTQLQNYKSNLQLNDWLYYQLIKETVNQLWKGKNKQQLTLNCWFLLSKSDFDTRVTFQKEIVYLYIYSEDAIFETPMIQSDDRNYINLSCINDTQRKAANMLNMLSFVANKNGKKFSFDLSSFPLLKPKIETKEFEFPWKNEWFKFKIDIDLTIYKVMQNYPILDEIKYLEIPLSNTIAKSLLPKFKEIFRGKSQKETIQILIAFTRSAFEYKKDQDHLGLSKPMIADEVFHYSYSDCEDRSALFYSLVRELLGLPMIVIAYPDHLTIAIAMKESIGNPIEFKGRKYYICDPTGPFQSIEIGKSPLGYENESFEIIGLYPIH